MASFRRPEDGLLNVDEVDHLRTLGDAIRAAPHGPRITTLIGLTIAAVAEYRSREISDEELAAHLGITCGVLNNWRRQYEPKASLSPPEIATPHPHIWSDLTQPATISVDRRASYLSGSINQHINQTQSASAAHSIHSTISTNMTSGDGIPRRVLVVSGDSRPGRNDFNLEMAEIRKMFTYARIDVQEMTAVELTEISQRLNDFQPSVLHICAHTIAGGVVLLDAEESVNVAHDLLWDAVTTAYAAPCLVVLNLCQWHW